MPVTSRPVSSLDHGISKGCITHIGLVFENHLDSERLKLAAEKLMAEYPELNVVVKRKLPSMGKLSTPTATSPAWDFQARQWPDKLLSDIYPLAVGASEEKIATTTRITDHGSVDTNVLNDLFHFGVSSILTLGITNSPILMFRVTLLGNKDAGHTAVGISVPHAVMDGQAVAELSASWARLYRGETLPERQATLHPDLLGLLGPAAKDEVVKPDEKPEQQFLYTQVDALRYIKDTTVQTVKGVEEHYIHVPKASLEKAKDEIRIAQTDGGSVPVSNMDIFCGLITKFFAASASVERAFDLYGAYYLSQAFPADSLPTPYLHNLFTFARFSFPSTSVTPAELATTIRSRLIALRSTTNVREHIKFLAQHEDLIVTTPRWDVNHGWGMVTSWREMREKIIAGFEGENLVFMRPRLQYPFDLRVPYVAIPFGDGAGGLWAAISCPKGQWQKMWDKAGLEHQTD